MAEKPQQPISIKDIISYTPEEYFSDEERKLLRSTFGGAQGQRLLKIVRKTLLPTVSDPDLPIEQLAKDLFMSAVDFRPMPAEEVKSVAMGLQLAVKVISGSLMQLRDLANVKEETVQEIAARRAKNSAR
jgi:hypothetical protein